MRFQHEGHRCARPGAEVPPAAPPRLRLWLHSLACSPAVILSPVKLGSWTWWEEDLGTSATSAPNQLNTLRPATALWSQHPALLMGGNEVSGSPPAPTPLPQWKAKLFFPSSSGHRCQSVTQWFWSESPLLLKSWKPSEKNTPNFALSGDLPYSCS